jgi:hypothetical protein
MIGRIEETSASYEARSAPRSYPTQNLPGLGFIAKARGDIGDRPDGGVIEASLEAATCVSVRANYK